MEVFVIYTQFYDDTQIKFALFSERAAKSWCERYNKRVRAGQAAASYENVSLLRRAPVLAAKRKRRKS